MSIILEIQVFKMPVLAIISEQKCFSQCKFPRGAKYVVKFFIGHNINGKVLVSLGRKLVIRLQLALNPRDELSNFISTL